jgi:hypothetical protein
VSVPDLAELRNMLGGVAVSALICGLATLAAVVLRDWWRGRGRHR